VGERPSRERPRVRNEGKKKRGGILNRKGKGEKELGDMRGGWVGDHGRNVKINPKEKKKKRGGGK